MPNPGPFWAAIVAQLETLDGVTVYDSYVPDKVPEVAGYILPYVVFWPGDTVSPDGPSVCGQLLDDAVILPFQTTSVAASPDAARALNYDVTMKLTNLPVGAGYVLPDTNSFSASNSIQDNQTTPSRHYVPKQWRLETQ